MKRIVDLAPAVVVGVAPVLLAVVTYGPAITGEYGRLDDYGYVVSSRTETLQGLRSFYLDSGRPLPALVMTILAPQVSTVEGLVWFRWACTLMIALGAVAAALMTYRLAAPGSRFVASVLALGAAGAALSTTSSPSTVTWAILAGSAFAFPAAMAAGLLATTTFRYWWLGSAALVAVAAFSYQHVAPAAVLPVLLWSAERWARREPPHWRRAFVVAGLAAVALAADFVLVKLRDGVGTARMTPVSTGERLGWFWDQFVPQTLDLAVPGTSTSASWSLALLAVLFLAPALAGPRHLVCSAAVLVTWAGTSVVVIPVELWASYRLASAAQFVIWVGAAACVAIGASRARWQPVRIGGAVAGVALAACALVVAGQRAVDYLAVPNEVDWAAMQCVVEKDKLISGAHLVQNDFGDSTSTVLDMDEYGIIASSVPWAFPHAMWLAQTEVSDNAIPGFGPDQLVVEPPGSDPSGAVVVPQDTRC